MSIYTLWKSVTSEKNTVEITNAGVVQINREFSEPQPSLENEEKSNGNFSTAWGLFFFTIFFLALSNFTICQLAFSVDTSHIFMYRQFCFQIRS